MCDTPLGSEKEVYLGGREERLPFSQECEKGRTTLRIVAPLFLWVLDKDWIAIG